MSFIDSHAHLTSSELLTHLDEVMERAKKAKISHIINVCTDAVSMQEGLKLQTKYPQIANIAAVHPHDVEKIGMSFFPVVERAANNRDIVAIGETGLDYFYDNAPRQLQKKFLAMSFDLAIRSALPIVFHCREAFSDLFKIADAQKWRGKALLHCFSGTIDEAAEALSRGWLLSFSGILTFTKAEALREVAKAAPIEQILIETDAPFLAPQSHRGKLNEPAFVVETANVLAQIKQIDLLECARITSKNAREFFSLI